MGTPLELFAATFLIAFVPGSLGTPWGQAGSYVSLALCVLATIGIVRLNPPITHVRSNIPFGFVSLLLLSTFFSFAVGRFDPTIIRGTPFQIGAFVSILSFVRIWRARGGDPEPWLKWLVAISLVVGCIAVFEYITKSFVEIDAIYERITGIAFDDSLYRRAADSFRAISTAGNPLILGMFSSIAGSISLALYVRRFSMFYLIAFAVNAAAAISTMSRSSWLALALGSTVVILRRLVGKGRVSHRAYVHYLIGLVLAALLLTNDSAWNALSDSWANFAELASDRVIGISESISYTHRMTSPIGAFTDMLTHPMSILVGYGLGAENYYFISVLGLTLSGDPIRDSFLLRTFDNTLVTMGYSFGLLGLGWLITVAVRAFRNIDLGDVTRDWYIGGFAATICAVCFFNAFGSPLAIFFLATFLGFGSASTGRAQRLSGGRRRPLNH
jgi:hypothetical protein